jgi:hypothetical protein
MADREVRPDGELSAVSGATWCRNLLDDKSGRTRLPPAPAWTAASPLLTLLRIAQ